MKKKNNGEHVRSMDRNKFEREKIVEARLNYLSEVNESLTKYITDYEKHTRKEIISIKGTIGELHETIARVNEFIREEVKLAIRTMLEGEE